MWLFTIVLLLLLCHVIVTESNPNYYVSNLPNSKPLTKESKLVSSYSGYINTQVSDSDYENLFFWLVPSLRRSPDTGANLVIWLNGGPGCSSMDGFFLEIGPWNFANVSSGLNLTYNGFGWHEAVDVLFVDQPVGTGFSFSSSGTEYVQNQDQMALHFLKFFQQFLGLFPQYNAFTWWLAGESYAGIYIPYIANAMLANDALQGSLKGLIIGNGWMDPLHQYPAYVDFAVANNLLSGAFLDQAQQKLTQCLQALNTQNTPQHIITQPTCESIVDVVTAQSVQNGTSCLNLYDIRYRDAPGAPQNSCGNAWPSQLGQVQQYLNLAPVKAAIHVDPNNVQNASVGPPAWTECQNKVSNSLKNQNSAPSVTLLPSLLQQLQILLFSGDKDFLCNYIGTEYMISNMSWGGAVGFGTNASAQDWLVEGQLAGKWTSARNLSLLRIYNSSHMVPYDKPATALAMLNTFLNLSLLLPGAQSSFSALNSTIDATPKSRLSYFTAGNFTLGLVFLLMLLIGTAIGVFIHFKDSPRFQHFFPGRRKHAADVETDPFLRDTNDFEFDSSVHMDTFPNQTR